MCKHDTAEWQEWQARTLGQELLKAQKAQGRRPRATVPQLAERFGLTERTTYRILTKAREVQNAAKA